jgi:hypothetical protein
MECIILNSLKLSYLANILKHLIEHFFEIDVYERSNFVNYCIPFHEHPVVLFTNS